MKISRLTPSKLRGECRLGFRNLDATRQQGAIDYALYKGPHYQVTEAAGMARGRYQPVNPTQMMVRTIASFLTPNAPLSDVTPKHIALDFEADLRKDIYDDQAEELKLSEVYQESVIDALLRGVSFRLTMLKTGGESLAIGGHSLDMGKIHTRLLDLDDVSLDPLAKSIRPTESRFIAFRYPVDREEAIDSVADGCYGALNTDYDDGLLPNDHIASPEEAVAILEELNSVENYPQRGERIDKNPGETYEGDDRLGETIMLWDVVVFTPQGPWIITLPGDPSMSDPFPTPGKGNDKFLACYKWQGPDSGPITAMSFLKVPFNKMPLALAQMQRDLAEVLDILANKTFRQLLATKNAAVYNPAAENMAMQLRRSENTSLIRGNPNDIKNIQLGGMVPDMMPGTQYFRDEWQNATGNLALAAGTGDDAKTATAFEGLMSRVQGFLDFMRTQVEQAATDDLQIRADMIDRNPVFQRRMQQTAGQGVASVGVSMNVVNQTTMVPTQQPDPMTGQMMPIPGMYQMQGTTKDFGLKTRAFSMAYANPMVQAQQVMTALAETIPAALAAGLDPRPVLKIIGRKLNEPQIDDLIPDPVSQAMQAQEEAMAMAMSQDPTGTASEEGGSYGQDGPAGRRLPGKARMAGRAMRPGPGTGAPRPMTMQMQGAA